MNLRQRESAAKYLLSKGFLLTAAAGILTAKASYAAVVVLLLESIEDDQA
jgi:hypothetical protein